MKTGRATAAKLKAGRLPEVMRLARLLPTITVESKATLKKPDTARRDYRGGGVTERKEREERKREARGDIME